MYLTNGAVIDSGNGNEDDGGVISLILLSEIKGSTF